MIYHVLGNLIEIIMIVYFYSLVFNSKLSFFKTFIVSCVFRLIIGALLINIWIDIRTRAPITIILEIIFITIMYRDNIFKKLFNLIVYFVMLVISETIAIFIYQKILNKDVTAFFDFNIYRFLMHVISCAITFILLMVYVKLSKKYILKIDENSALHIILYCFTQSIMAIVIYSLMIDYKILPSSLLILIFFIVLISFFVGFSMIKAFGRNATTKAEKKFYKEQLQLRDLHFEEINNQYIEYKKLRHDFYEHINIIDGLKNSGSTRVLNTYIEDVKNKLESTENLIFCKNPALDILFYNKNQKAKKFNIKTEYRITEPPEGLLSDMDLCSIVSNLLENAIRGAIEFSGEGKFLSFESYIKSGQFVIVVQNSSNLIENTETTKPDKLNHGYGIKIIESIAKQNNGNVVFRYDEGVFTSIIGLRLKDQ